MVHSLLEADKSRFLEPLYNEFKSQYGAIPDYNSLLKFVNSDDPTLKDINWQKVASKKTSKEERENYFDIIIQKFSDRLKKQSNNQEKKIAHAQGSIVDMAKAEGLQVVEEGSDTSNATGFVHLASLDTDKFTFLAPMSWEACKFCDSVQAGGEGAKWCIGYEQSDSYWKDYLDDGDIFIFAFNKEAYKDKKRATDTLKYMIELSADASLTQAWLQSDDPDETIAINKFKSVFGKSAVEMVEAFAPAILIDDNAYNNNQDFIDLDTGEAQIPWEDGDLIDNTFYLKDFYNGEYDIYDKTPLKDGLTKGEFNKQRIYDKVAFAGRMNGISFSKNQGYVVVEINCGGMLVEPEKMHIGHSNFGGTLDLPTFTDWLADCGVDDCNYIEFINGKFTQVNWEPEASKNTCDIYFTDCDIKKLNFTDFSDGHKSLSIQGGSIDELHWPVPQEDFDQCTSDSLIVNGQRIIKDETYEEDEINESSNTQIKENGMEYLKLQLNEELYKALADICYDYHQCGEDITEDDLKEAFDWCVNRLFDEEYTNYAECDTTFNEAEDPKRDLIAEAKTASEAIFNEAGWTYTSVSDTQYEVTVPEGELYQIGEADYIRAFWDAFADWRSVAWPGASIPVDIDVDVIDEEEGFVTFVYSLSI